MKPRSTARSSTLATVEGDIPRLHGQHLNPGLAAEPLLEYLDIMHELDRLVVPDIIETKRGIAGGRIRRRRRPAIGRSRRAVDHAHHPFHDVVDVGEVAHHAPMVEDLDGGAFQDPLGEQKQGHVRTSPRPIDREEPQTRTRQAKQVGIAVRHELVGTLAGRVQGHRVSDAIVFGKRLPAV